MENSYFCTCFFRRETHPIRKTAFPWSLLPCPYPHGGRISPFIPKPVCHNNYWFITFSVANRINDQKIYSFFLYLSSSKFFVSFHITCIIWLVGLTNFGKRCYPSLWPVTTCQILLFTLLDPHAISISISKENRKETYFIVQREYCV